VKSHRNDKKDFIKLLKMGNDEELSLFLSNVDAKKVLAQQLTKHGETALHICAKDNPARIPYLLSLGADVTIKNKSGNDALQILLQKKNFSMNLYGEIAMLLARQGADINARGYKDRTLLHYVARAEGCKFNDAQFYGINELLGMGADASIKDTSGHNALRWYTDSRTRPLTHPDSYFGKSLLFIKQGADPNTKNKTDETLLHEAAILKPQYIADLLKSGVDPNIKVKLKVKSENMEAEWNYTPLSLLIENKQGFDFKYAMKLVHHGADPNAQDFYRRTLMLLAAKSKPKFIPELITYGAKANNGDIWRADELKALMDNEKFNFKHAIFMIMNGADARVKNQHNKTLLHFASISRSRYIPLLLHFGVDPDAQDDAGLTALQILMSKNKLKKTDIDSALALIQYSKKDIDSTLGEKLLKKIYKKYPDIKNYLAACGVPDHEMEDVNYIITHINIASLRLEIKYQSRPQIQQERSQHLNALLILADDFFNKTSDSYFKKLPYEVIIYIISMLPSHSSEITPEKMYSFGDHIFSNWDEARKMMKTPGGFNIHEQKDDTGASTFRFFKSAQTFAQQFDENSQKYQGSKQKLKKGTVNNSIKCWDNHSSLFVGQSKITLLESIKGTRLYQDEKIQAKLKI
jgi:ankyrin repeat protein